jgi:hypothetical protein
VSASKAGRPPRLKLQMVKEAASPGDFPCFTIIRNERYFLPHLLGHYRGLGVSHFIFYDDRSDDGSREFLLGQPDCTIVTSPYHFRQQMWDGRPFHYHARTAIPEHYGKGGWCLVVDADEFLLLPRRFGTLAELSEELDARGEIAVLAAMVDFYPESLRKRNYDAALGPLEAGPWWFDPDRTFDRVPGTARIEARHAGLRIRLIRMLQASDPQRVREIYPFEEGQIYRSHLWKVPLIKTGQGLVRLNTHSVNKPTAEGIQLALAHFKFHPATDRKISEALEWKSYAHQSIEYRLFEAAIECFEDTPLVNDTSVQFRSAKSLEEAGLLFA